MISRMIRQVAALLLLIPSFANACPDALGYAVLKMAWPTPVYKKCDYSITPQSDGTKLIKIKAFGESRVSLLSDKEVWIEANLTLDRQGGISDVKWGAQKAFVPPGVTNLAIMQSAFAK